MQYKNIGMQTPRGEEIVRIALDSPVCRGKIKGLPEIDYPATQGWFGYNENFGTGRPLADGKLIPYTQRRVLWMIEWASRHYAIDLDRVSLHGSSMGSVGALTIGLSFPDRFASIHPNIPILSSEEVEDPRGGASRSAATASSSSRLRFSAVTHIKRHPQLELPYIQYTAGRLDSAVGWPNKITFARNMEELKVGYAFYWDLRAHTGPFAGTPPPGLPGPPIYWDRMDGGATVSVADFSRKQSYPALARLSVNDDPGTVDFAVRGATPRPPWDTPGAGDLIGTMNGAATWDRATLIDLPDHYEITLKLLPVARSNSGTADVTPRRLQRFKPMAGNSYAFVVTEEGASKALASGIARADAQGRVTVVGVPITKRGTRLTIRPAGG